MNQFKLEKKLESKVYTSLKKLSEYFEFVYK